MRSGMGNAITSAQFGMASKMKPLTRLSRIVIGWGTVSATTWSDASRWNDTAIWSVRVNCH